VARCPWRRSAAAERLDPQAAYTLWAPSYPPRPHNRLMEIEQRTLLSLLPDVRSLAALDAGCGSGRYLKALQDRGAVAMGVDLSDAMLARARTIGARIVRGDLCALPFEAASLDLVVCGLALGDVAALDVALAEIARVLRPGGGVIYSVVHPAGAAAGWSRTFESNGRQCAIDGHWHSLDQHRRACARAQLRIDAWLEPAVDGGADPAVLVVRARTFVEPASNLR
jgi:malonyl-CoA O-methyltransferase